MLELLAGAALRSLFLAAAVGTGLRLRRSYNPHVSLAAWTLVLAASLLMPVAMQLTPIALPHGVIPLEIVPAAITVPIGQQSFALEIDPAGLETAAVPSRTEPDAPPTASLAAEMRWGEIASFLYLAVFSVLMMRLLAGSFAVVANRAGRDADSRRLD